MVELSPSPKPLVLYSFAAFFFVSLAFREAYTTESTWFGTAIWLGLSIGSLVILFLKWWKDSHEDSDGVATDELNRAVSKLMIDAFLARARGYQCDFGTLRFSGFGLDPRW